MVKPWYEIPAKSNGEMVIPETIRGSKKRVIKLTAQENKLSVIKFMGRRRSLMIGLTILFKRSQIMDAVKSVLKSWSIEKPE
jgi:hypothetical protein